MAIPAGHLPILPLRNTVVFPGVSQALRVGRELSVKALQKAFEGNNWIVTVAQKEGTNAPQVNSDLYTIGTLCKIESVRGNAENGFSIVVRGHHRVTLREVQKESGFFEAMTESIDETADLDEATHKALLGSLKDLSLQVLALIPADTSEMEGLVQGAQDLSFLVHTAAAQADFDVREKQNLLELSSLKEKTMALLNLLQGLKERLQVQTDIRSKLQDKFGQNHREQILREQMKAIKEELGEGEEGELDGLYRKKISQAEMPPDALKLAESQLKRLLEVPAASPEHHVIRHHLDLMVGLPWSKSSAESDIDLLKAREILDADHHGLEKVKKRILQHLAVMKLKKNQQGSILLLIGPPGVGKTSLAASIAKALGRQYVRMSLGGVRDDSEIRGHRRTYVGALPGRIIQGLKKAEENNPVFVLDEIDKMSRSFAGDPAAAMLEVLDPEQNATFVDHFLEASFDLSKVFFIGTANSYEGIPAPLLDRLEIIDLTGYTAAEKLHIARSHLIPQQLENFGVTTNQWQIQDDALVKVISSYTREAGVRDLQRKIAELIRAVTEQIVQSKGEPVRIGLADVETILGPEKFVPEVADHASESGVVTGLAWTPVGGDILLIESAVMPGSGQLLMTGQLGDVMKESARIALSLLKSRLPLMADEGAGLELGKKDLHIHVPAGAIPKDGPSAGVTILTSLASLLSHRRVDPRLAMTGEITLRGAVMPVGGIKEKLLAAHRAGVKTVLLPQRNAKDLLEVPEEIRAQLKIQFVSNVNEVLKYALGLDSIVVHDVVDPVPPMIPPPVDA